METLFKIYQIKDIENCNYSFMGLDFAKKHGLALDDYKVVYTFGLSTLLLDHELDKNEDYLEIIFRMFNRVTKEDADRLEFIGFKGHSLSVSDIVYVDGTYYYCDSCGWEEIKMSDGDILLEYIKEIK